MCHHCAILGLSMLLSERDRGRGVDEEVDMRRWNAIVVAACGALLLVPALAGPAAAAGGAPLAQSTVDNTVTALRGEAYAHATYLAFGEAAAQAGEARVGRLFTR